MVINFVLSLPCEPSTKILLWLVSLHNKFHRFRHITVDCQQVCQVNIMYTPMLCAATILCSPTILLQLPIKVGLHIPPSYQQLSVHFPRNSIGCDEAIPRLLWEQQCVNEFLQVQFYKSCRVHSKLWWHQPTMPHYQKRQFKANGCYL